MSRYRSKSCNATSKRRIGRFSPTGLALVGWAWKIVKRLTGVQTDDSDGWFTGIPVFEVGSAKRSLFPCAHGCYMQGGAPLDRYRIRLLTDELNKSNDFLTVNHRRPATFSTIRLGVRPDKVVAWDLAGLPAPKLVSPKRLKVRRGLPQVLFVGQLKPGKGIGDLLQAVRLLDEGGCPVEPIFCGDGEMAASASPSRLATPNMQDSIQGQSRK